MSASPPRTPPRHRHHPNFYLAGNYAPLREEFTLEALEIEGSLPEALEGTFYRIGPDPQFEPYEPYTFFEGDGMVHALALEGGRASYRNRWVRTRRFEQERAAGRALFGLLYTFKYTLLHLPHLIKACDLSVLDFLVKVALQGKTQLVFDALSGANTTLIPHAGQLLATYEPSPPTCIDPVTLETREMARFGSGFSGPFTPHPKIDSATGEMFAFGYSLGGRGPWCRYYIIDRRGRMVRDEPVDLPHATVMHDFVVTKRHTIFLVFPLVVDANPLKGASMRWEPERGTRLGVMPRYGSTSELRWIEMDPCFAFHLMNAWSVGERVVVDLARMPALPEYVTDLATTNPIQLDSHMTRWEVDVVRGRVSETVLDHDYPVEFPRFDDRFAMQENRVGFASAQIGDTVSPEWLHNGVIRYDYADDTRQIHSFGEDTCCEVAFVPRSVDAPEGDGYLMTVVYNAETDRSRLVVLDSARVNEKPLAQVFLPHRIPNGFHTTWLAKGTP